MYKNLAWGIMLILSLVSVSAVTDCTFTIAGMTMSLDASCTTDETLFVQDGFTFDGMGNTITAVDPAADHFRGGVIENNGSSGHVTNTTINATNLTNVCDGGDDRLRGIMFDGASGSITHNTILAVNQGASGCQEGNAVEVRNSPFDGTHPDTKAVEIHHNHLADWQKTGIVCNGDVNCNIHHNDIDASISTKVALAPNSIQLGFGAFGTVIHNNIEGSSWCGPSNFVGTGILLFSQDANVDVSRNNIRGDSDVGIFVVGDDANVDNNKVFDDKNAEDCNQFEWDIGIWNFGSGNSYTNNKVKGFDTAYEGVVGGKNKKSPGPNGPNSGNPFW